MYTVHYKSRIYFRDLSMKTDSFICAVQLAKMLEDNGTPVTPLIEVWYNGNRRYIMHFKPVHTRKQLKELRNKCHCIS